MTTAIHAIDENGVFRPIQPVDLPDRCEVINPTEEDGARAWEAYERRHEEYEP